MLISTIDFETFWVIFPFTMSTKFLRLRTWVLSFIKTCRRVWLLTHSFTNAFMSLSLSNYISLTLLDYPILLILAQTNNTFHWVSKWWKLVMEGRLILSPVIYGGIMEKVCSYRRRVVVVSCCGDQTHMS